MESKIHIVDAIMGSGKTSAAINYINSLDDDTKVLYVTPYLSEVKRIKSACKEKEFNEPFHVGGRKLNGLKDLMVDGENIVTTHSLFHLFDSEVIELCKAQNYILFLDEVADVIELYDGLDSKKDYDVFMQEFAYVDVGSSFVKWKGDEHYDGKKFYVEKAMCDLECLASYGSSSMLVKLFPFKVFDAFAEVYVMTYMFKSQVQAYYYDFYKVNYDYLYIKGDSVDNFTFTKNPDEKRIVKRDYKSLINIFDNVKINRIGDDYYALSKNWYLKNKDSELITILKNNTYNFFTNKIGKGSSHNAWTTFSDFKGKLSGNGYGKGFIPQNLKASNDYSNKDCVAYLVNRFFNPVIANFFLLRSIDVDSDGFALSEMLQFIWRSAIRNDEPIDIYIPSKRMRGLLENWIEENSI